MYVYIYMCIHIERESVGVYGLYVLGWLQRAWPVSILILLVDKPEERGLLALGACHMRYSPNFKGGYLGVK